MAAATYTSSSVENQKSTTIVVIVSELLDASTDLTGFAVSINAGADVATSLVVLQGTNQINITISQSVIDTDTLTVAYAGAGAIVSETGGEGLTIFTVQAVTNNTLAILTAADVSLLTGVYVANDDIEISYDGSSAYTTINNNQMNTPSILRTALNNAGIYIEDDRRGTFSKIDEARDYILASI